MGVPPRFFFIKSSVKIQERKSQEVSSTSEQIVKMRIFDVHKDIWSLGFPFILSIIHIHFSIVLAFEIEPKQGYVENVNWFKNVYCLLDISSI